MANKQLIFLLRHAKSDWNSAAASDFERPLNHRGRQDAPRMGHWLAENYGLPERIIASPAARATETAMLVCASFEAGALIDNMIDKVIYEPNLYHGSGQQIHEIAAEHLQKADRILIVAHNPGMEMALLDFCPTAQPFADGKLMPTCALAVIEFDRSAASGGGILQALIRPSELPPQ